MMYLMDAITNASASEGLRLVEGSFGMMVASMLKGCVRIESIDCMVSVSELESMFEPRAMGIRVSAYSLSVHMSR